MLLLSGQSSSFGLTGHSFRVSESFGFSHLVCWPALLGAESWNQSVVGNGFAEAGFAGHELDWGVFAGIGG